MSLFIWIMSNNVLNEREANSERKKKEKEQWQNNVRLKKKTKK